MNRQDVLYGDSGSARSRIYPLTSMITTLAEYI